MSEPTAYYLVWSVEHRGWWRPGYRGYTTRTDKAGRYSKGEAIDICEQANRMVKPGEQPEEFMVPAPTVGQCDLDMTER